MGGCIEGTAWRWRRRARRTLSDGASAAKRGLSQNRVADEAGLTQGQVSAIERGKANPTMESWGRIAQVLGVEVDVLFMKPGSM
jgi:DNA-binding XRE family transcriptional regulator